MAHLSPFSQSSLSALWVRLFAIGLPTGFALWLYWFTAAPGLTWAHYGVDGGDLLAAAMVNGVAHPTGYPFYTLLLRGWLWLGYLMNPQLESAFWGNRLSGLCVAGAVALTVAATASLLRLFPLRWLWATLAGLLFAVTPLAWSQAIITEVYGLHALLITAMGWAVFSKRLPLIGMGVLMGLGAAHHLTSLLLWPALLYWTLQPLPRQAWLGACVRMFGVALFVALIFYGSIVWRMASAVVPPPIAWGYPRDFAGLWWLVSGAAYRAYLFGMTPLQYGGRLAALARLLVEQFTPVGLAFVIGGFAVWDRQRAALRNGALLWILPLSLYAAGYNTIDSYIYLLPVVWLLSLMLAQGLASGHTWLTGHWHSAPTWTTRFLPGFMATATLIAIVALVTWRLPAITLADDHAAQDFLNEATTTLEAGSLVISNADAPTFALWYGQWAGDKVESDDRLLQTIPDLVFVNYALYQFGWYRNLMHDLYPEVPMLGATFIEFIAANRPLRPIYTTEPLPELPPAELTPVGIFWRLNTP